MFMNNSGSKGHYIRSSQANVYDIMYERICEVLKQLFMNNGGDKVNDMRSSKTSVYGMKQ